MLPALHKLDTQLLTQAEKTSIAAIMRDAQIDRILPGIRTDRPGEIRADVLRDGNCLFHCIARGLLALGMHNKSADAVRDETVAYVTEHWEYFRNANLLHEYGSPKIYMQKMGRRGCWGGEVELQATAMAYGVNVITYSFDGVGDNPTTIEYNTWYKKSTLNYVFTPQELYDDGLATLRFLLAGNHWYLIHPETTAYRSVRPASSQGDPHPPAPAVMKSSEEKRRANQREQLMQARRKQAAQWQSKKSAAAEDPEMQRALMESMRMHEEEQEMQRAKMESMRMHEEERANTLIKSMRKSVAGAKECYEEMQAFVDYVKLADVDVDAVNEVLLLVVNHYREARGAREQLVNLSRTQSETDASRKKQELEDMELEKSTQYYMDRCVFYATYKHTEKMRDLMDKVKDIPRDVVDDAVILYTEAAEIYLKLLQTLKGVQCDAAVAKRKQAGVMLKTMENLTALDY